MSHNGNKSSKKDKNINIYNIFVFFGRFTPIVRHSLNTSTCIFCTLYIYIYHIHLENDTVYIDLLDDGCFIFISRTGDTIISSIAIRCGEL